jgi:chromosome segregation ATPase
MPSFMKAALVKTTNMPTWKPGDPMTTPKLINFIHEETLPRHLLKDDLTQYLNHYEELKKSRDAFEKEIEKLKKTLEITEFHEKKLRDPVANLYKQIRELKKENEFQKDLADERWEELNHINGRDKKQEEFYEHRIKNLIEENKVKRQELEKKLKSSNRKKLLFKELLDDECNANQSYFEELEQMKKDMKSVPEPSS